MFETLLAPLAAPVVASGLSFGRCRRLTNAAGGWCSFKKHYFRYCCVCIIIFVKFYSIQKIFFFSLLLFPLMFFITSSNMLHFPQFRQIKIKYLHLFQPLKRMHPVEGGRDHWKDLSSEKKSKVIIILALWVSKSLVLLHNGEFWHMCVSKRQCSVAASNH